MIRERAYRIDVETLEPLRVGGAPDPLSSQDLPTAVVGNEFTIPGSSLKGALRAAMEQHLIDRYYDAAAGRWPDAQRAAQPCMAATQVSVAEEQLLQARKYRRFCRYSDRQPGQQSVCPACYLLGAAGLVGFVRVPFLWSDESPSQLTAIRLDRASGIAADGPKREYQFIRRGAHFTGDLYVTEADTGLGWRVGEPRPLPGNPDGWLGGNDWRPEQVISELLVARLEGIIYLGGYRSKGMGRVKVTVQRQEG